MTVLFVLWLSLVLFMPKKHLYFKLEHLLDQQHVRINESKISEGLFTLKIEEASIYIRGIDLVHIRLSSFFSLLLYSRIAMKEITLDSSLEGMVPTHLDSIVFSHVLWSPQYLSVSGNGEFGAFQGVVDLVRHKVHLDFPEMKKPGVLKHQLKQGEKGWYYETSF